MRDIVERLRDYDKCTVGPQEATDEIELLRAENEKLRGLLREAHVKMVENDLWVNLRQRVVAAIRGKE